MFDKFRRARRGYNLIRGARDFIRELARQENRCLGNPEIRRPFLGFIHAAHQRRVFFRRKVGVESGAKFRIHVTVRRLLFAVRPRINDAVDVKRAQYRGCILVRKHNYAVSARRDLGVINGRH